MIPNKEARRAEIMPIERILFVTSEAHPLIKTGGLADVSGSLPATLADLGKDVRLVLPAYRSLLADYPDWVEVGPIPAAGPEARILEGRLPGTQLTTWLIDIPRLFDRDGGPYCDADGRDWPDNAQRFAGFCRAVEAIAAGELIPGWLPDVVHCNDWQTGLVPALLGFRDRRPGTVFTIHNLAYQGLFPAQTLHALGLPAELWSPHALEFYGQLSFIKGGLVFADMLSTVSPTYAREIQTAEFGCGLDPLLQYRQERLVGILNGADYTTWNPETDTHLAHPYGPEDLAAKGANKAALQSEFGLPVEADIPLIGMVSRLAEQKGFDLLIEALPGLMQKRLQIVVLGSGDKRLEQALLTACKAYPEGLAVEIGYDESLSHRIEGGADMFLMPSRYEPCGLNQIYSLRYGTIPIVHRTGGLADPVVDLTPTTRSNHTATGFVFDTATASDLRAAVMRALDTYRQPDLWQELMRTAMAQDFSWDVSARRYLDLYRLAYEYHH